MKWLTLDLHEPPATRWLVENLIPEQALVCLYSAPNTGKTFIALDIGLSVAFGQQAFTQTSPENNKAPPRPVVFVLREALHNIHRRIAAWCDFHNIPRETAQKHLAETFLIPDTSDDADIRIDRTRSRRKLITAIKQRCPNPALIVLDPLVDMMDGDENSARDMSRFVNGLNELRTQLGACVLVIHHQGKYWRPIERGSSVLQAAVDTHIHLLDPSKTARARRKTANDDTSDRHQKIELDIHKQRDAARAPNIHIELRTVPEHGSSNALQALGKVPVRIQPPDESMSPETQTASKGRTTVREPFARKPSPRKQQEEKRRKEIIEFLNTQWAVNNNAPVLRQELEAHFSRTPPTTLHRDLALMAKETNAMIEIATTGNRISVKRKEEILERPIEFDHPF